VRKWKSDFEDDPTKNWDVVASVNEVPIIPGEWAMVHFRGATKHPGFTSLKGNFQALMKYFEVDCSVNATSCPPPKGLPEVRFFYSGKLHHVLAKEGSYFRWGAKLNKIRYYSDNQ
jgi:hypothetical protein